jgi:hypothetical protein
MPLDSSSNIQPGDYILQVIGASDGYKTVPEDRSKPTRPRRVSLFLKVVEPIPNGTQLGFKGDEIESRESFESRRASINKTGTCSIFFSSNQFAQVAYKYSAKQIARSLQMLVTITGQPTDIPKSMEKYKTGVLDGKDQYNMEEMIEEIHLNCTALLGRTFVGRINSVRPGPRRPYINLSNYFIRAIPESSQPKWDGISRDRGDNLFSGYDKASEDFIVRVLKMKPDPTVSFDGKMERVSPMSPSATMGEDDNPF